MAKSALSLSVKQMVSTMSSSTRRVVQQYGSSPPGRPVEGSEGNIRRATLDELSDLYDRGELEPSGDKGEIPEDEFPDDFWDRAVMVDPPPRSVHLKLDRDVFDYFKAQGKGHLTRMQNVLRAYVRAQKSRSDET